MAVEGGYADVLKMATRAMQRWAALLWPDCPHCSQSMTGAYNGRLFCVRCSSRRRLTKG